MLDGISWEELERWAAFYRLEPWGDWAANARAALIAATIANANRDSKARPEPYTIDDFMLFVKQEETGQKGSAAIDAGADDGKSVAKIDPALVGWLFSKSKTVLPQQQGG